MLSEMFVALMLNGWMTMPWVYLKPALPLMTKKFPQNNFQLFWPWTPPTSSPKMYALKRNRWTFFLLEGIPSWPQGKMQRYWQTNLNKENSASTSNGYLAHICDNLYITNKFPIVNTMDVTLDRSHSVFYFVPHSQAGSTMLHRIEETAKTWGAFLEIIVAASQIPGKRTRTQPSFLWTSRSCCFT